MLNNNVIHMSIDGIDVLKFVELERYDNIEHAFSLKPLSFRNRSEICDEYKRLFCALKLDYSSLVKPSQSHTDNILVINEKYNNCDADINLEYLENVDATITNQTSIALASTSADCLCVILYDDVKKVIANVHSGWRGTFKRIVRKTVEKMAEIYGSNPLDIKAFLTPAIRKCHFEVEDDVVNMCKNVFENVLDVDKVISIGRNVNGVQKYNMDNVLINKMLLESIGILSKNIIDSGICSVCNHESIHSKRADGENFGLATTIVMMK